MLVRVQEGQVIECSQVSDIREGVSPRVRQLYITTHSDNLTTGEVVFVTPFRQF